MRKRNCDVSALSAAWNGTRCRRANAKISLTIFCTRIVRAENSGLRHQYPVLRSRLEGQAFPVPRIGARRRGRWRDLPRIARRVGGEASIEALLHSGADARYGG